MKNLLILITFFGSMHLKAQNDVALISNHTIQTFQSNYSSTGNVSTESTEVKKITYEDHLHEAKSFNIPIIENFEQMDSLIQANQLIAVPEDSELFKIQKLTHSRAYLNASALTLLSNLAEKFHKETNTSLSISSLTRTLETQNKLRRVNSNAAKGESSHAYGASFDISYTQYGDKKGRNYVNERILEEILNQMVEDGQIYFIKERRQPCYHITVRNTNISL